MSGLWRLLTGTRAASPAKGRAASPAKGRAASPAKGRAASPAKGRAASPIVLTEANLEKIRANIDAEQARLDVELAKVMKELKPIAAQANAINAALAGFGAGNLPNNFNLNAELDALGNASNNEGTGRGAGASGKGTRRRSKTGNGKGAAAAATRAATNAMFNKPSTAQLNKIKANYGFSNADAVVFFPMFKSELEEAGIFGGRRARKSRKHRRHTKRRGTRRHR